VQAAVLRVLLPHLDDWCERRRAAGAAYVESGMGRHVGMPVVPDGATPAWHLFVVTHPRADALLAELDRSGIQARPYYRTPLHRQPAMRAFVTDQCELPATDELAASILALPMSPALDVDEIAQVAASVTSFLTPVS
jgi:dTDP-4-amino-4,6-dideoxygalactose transaminase